MAGRLCRRTPAPGSAKNGSALIDWFPLPSRGPDEMVLPGFHSASEVLAEAGQYVRAARRSPTRDREGTAANPSRPATKSSSASAASCPPARGRCCSSRWRSGGQSSLDLVREFTQELPHTTPADAWQRAVQVVSNSPLAVESEPRVKKLTDASADGPALPGLAPVLLGRLHAR